MKNPAREALIRIWRASFGVETLYQLKQLIDKEAAALPDQPVAGAVSHEMEVSLDGGDTWQECDGVRVSYNGLEIPGEDEKGELAINLTSEGLILDVWVDRSPECHNLATESITVDEKVLAMIEADA